jgi:hypothetical protein
MPGRVPRALVGATRGRATGYQRTLNSTHVEFHPSTNLPGLLPVPVFFVTTGAWLRWVIAPLLRVQARSAELTD